MSATAIAVVAVFIWLFAMGASWCLSWMNALSAIFVAGVIAIGVAVSWQRVEQHTAQNQTRKNAVTALYNRPNFAPVTVPPPDHPHAGT
jgi:uncharacterized membrane protein YraQ (UPF0718 family)